MDLNAAAERLAATGPSDYGRANAHLLGNARADITAMHAAVLAIHSPVDRYHHDRWGNELFDTAKEAETNYHEQCTGEDCEPARISTVQHCAACGPDTAYPCATVQAVLGHEPWTGTA